MNVLTHVYICIYVCIHEHVYISNSIYIYNHTHTYFRAHTSSHTHTRTHTHTPTHTHTHRHTHAQTQTQTLTLPRTHAPHSWRTVLSPILLVLRIWCAKTVNDLRSNTAHLCNYRAHLWINRAYLLLFYSYGWYTFDAHGLCMICGYTRLIWRNMGTIRHFLIIYVIYFWCSAFAEIQSLFATL